MSTTSSAVAVPPADIKATIDRTCKKVAENPGTRRDFEAAALRSGRATFDFFKPNHPFRAYYELRLKKNLEGLGDEEIVAERPEGLKAIEKERQLLDAKARAKEEKKIGRKALIGDLPKALEDLSLKEDDSNKHGDTGNQQIMVAGSTNTLNPPQAKRKEVTLEDLRPPPEDVFSIKLPSIAPLDVDVIKVTATFVARNGASFLEGLSQRENQNPQFDFIKPSHHLFHYFTTLVDSYTRVLKRKAVASVGVEKKDDQEVPNVLAPLKKLATDDAAVMSAAIDRFR